MDCYVCQKKAAQRCPRCGNAYCRDHGEDPSSGSGQALCADCLNPINAAPSGTFFRASLLLLLVGSVLALWLLIRPPGLPGESSEVIAPEPSPSASPGPVTPPPPLTPTAEATATPTPTATPPGPPTDSDNDGFSNTLETHAGTDPFDICSWPPDLSGDGWSDITDISTLASSFGQSVPSVPGRGDFAPDPLFDNVVDITDIAAAAGRFGAVCADSDGDSIPNPSDNCPGIANPDQLDVSSNSLGDACDPGDFDNDGFTDRVEYRAGTDRGADCATSPSHDAWPADTNNDTVSDIADISALAGSFGQASPPAPARHNIAPDPTDGVVDITDIARAASFFARQCS